MALSTSYYFTQTQATLSSSSQATTCQNIVKQALEDTVSLGARLYGYKINHNDSNLRYNPLFIKKNTKAYDVYGNIDDVNDGSELSFPPYKYTTLFKNLGLTVSSQSPKDNTDKLVIGDTYPYDISTSVLLVNSVNALQYLYNSDNGFFTENGGKGKKYTVSAMSSGGMSSVLEKYVKQFDLEDVSFYIKIAPIDLQTNKVMISPPSHILTRPRFHNPSSVTVSPALNVLGDQEIGFEITAMLKYEREDQEYTCNGMHRFTHQIKPITRNNRPLSASLTDLVNGAGKDFLTDTSLKNTSCDTDGTGYDDITLTVDFSNVEEGQQLGTVILCRMNSYCRSYGDGSYGASCSPEKGRWQRCDDIQPNPSPTDQSWTYKAKLKASQEVVMTFEDMKVDRRYELNIGEFSIAGHNLRFRKRAEFFIDATRPSMGSVRITNDAVGGPTDQREDRNYNGPFTYWKRPSKSTSRWIQCNTNTVEFSGNIIDQFTHNLETCVFTGSKRDGNGTSTTSPTSTADCAGELSSVTHGRQTITFAPSDSCSHRTAPPALGTPKDLVWDTDLPSTFQTQNFPSNPKWLKSVNKNTYTIKTVVPGTGSGKFPKHYSVDCDDNYLDPKSRRDGNSGLLSCELKTSNPDHDDGCNPIELAAKYYHICGGTGACKKSNWGVYAPHTESCQNVRCEPGLICCDGFRNECGSVSTNECETNSYSPVCTNPKGGGNTQQDALSGCPPLGLYNCNYSLPCEATSPAALTGPSSVCVGDRQGDSCSFPVTGTCTPNAGTNWQSSPPSTAGTCSFSGISYTESCTAGSTRRCISPCMHTCYDACHSGHTRTVTSQVCSPPVFDSNGDCVGPLQTVTTTVTDPCTHTTCNPHSCHSCHDYEHRATVTTCSRTFSGSCGVPSGGCSPLGVGGGNLSLEQCARRPATCGGPPPPLPKCGCSSGNCVTGSAGSSTSIGTDLYRWPCTNGGATISCEGPSNCNCTGTNKHASQALCQTQIPSGSTSTCELVKGTTNCWQVVDGECVKIHGKTCCPTSTGGTCTGQLCAVNCATKDTCHVQDVGDGVCRPSCGHLARQQGYGDYGADGIMTTADDTHIFSFHKWGSTTCAALNSANLWGSNNWIKIPLIGGIEPYDGVQIGFGGECCGRDMPKDPNKADGKCGGYHDTNKCEEGTEKDLAESGTKHTWRCEGESGGTDANNCEHDQCGCNDGCTQPTTGCSTSVNGQCGNYHNTNRCSKGTEAGLTTSGTKHTWRCEGESGGTDANNCEHDQCGCNDGCTQPTTGCSTSVNGQCGNYHNTNRCSKGTEAGLTTSGTKYTWQCEGESGGTDANDCEHERCDCNSCTQPDECSDDEPDPSDPAESGVCSVGGCSKGKKVPKNALPKNNETWVCEGTNGGTNTDVCPIDGKCSKNDCKRGKKKKGTDGDGNANWKCKGLGVPIGTTTDWCKPPPECASSDCTAECCVENNCCPECTCGSGLNTCGNGCTYDETDNDEIQNSGGIIHNRIKFTCERDEYESKNCFYEIKTCTTGSGLDITSCSTTKGSNISPSCRPVNTTCCDSCGF